MKKEIYLSFFLLLVAISTMGQITSVFVDDNSKNSSHSVKMYDLLKETLPSMEYFNAVDSARSPKFSEMSVYDLVVWYSGPDNEELYFWNGNETTNQELMDYLDDGGNLWLMGNGFMNDRFHTTPLGFDQNTFVWKYLGIKTWFGESFTDDGGKGVPQLDKRDDSPVYTLTLETVNWKNPPEPYVDGCKLTSDASPIYEMGPLGYVLSKNFAGFYLKSEKFNNITFTFDPFTMDTVPNIRILFSGITGFYQDILSGIGEHNLKNNFSLDIYPNPASVSFKAITNLEGEVTYKLLDLTGNTVKEIKSGHPGSKGDEVVISVGSLPPGMYFLMADNGSSRLSKKVIVSR